MESFLFCLCFYFIIASLVPQDDHRNALFERTIDAELFNEQFLNVAHGENDILLFTRQSAVLSLNARSIPVVSKVTVRQSCTDNAITTS